MYHSHALLLFLLLKLLTDDERGKIPFKPSHQTIWKWLLCCAEAVAASSKEFNVAIEQSQPLPDGLA